MLNKQLLRGSIQINRIPLIHTKYIYTRISHISSADTHNKQYTTLNYTNKPIHLHSSRLFSASTSVEPIHVPELGEDIKSCKLISFSKSVGDNIEQDDVIATIETDKVACDIRVPNTGVVKKLYYSINDTININDIIADIEVQDAASAGESGATDIRTEAGQVNTRGTHESIPGGKHDHGIQYIQSNQKIVAGML